MRVGEARTAREGLPFESLLEDLRHGGFPIGADHYLRMNRVLDMLGPECEGPAQIGAILCPIFATSGEQQAAFQRIYAD